MGSRVFSVEEMESQVEGNAIDQVSVEERGQGEPSTPYHFEEFMLFESNANFCMIGRDEERKCGRMLKISRSEPSELVICEDPTEYTSISGSMEDIKKSYKLTDGHKFVTKCYGIVGFIRLLGPYYIIIITKRKEIGKICGHPIYAVSEYKMIPIPHSTVLSYLDNFEQENRYKKLLCLVDITKDFFFSYSYPIMHSLQKNLCQEETRQVPSQDTKNMFVWNEYLTSEIRHRTLWTVALVHGFFNQVELSLAGKIFIYTLIARRSCQFAGPRYEKRGVNEEGQAANEVEIEQIASKDIHGECPSEITSSLQTRSSIPLKWFQDSSWLILRPDIKLSEPEGNNSNKATLSHFLNLLMRYGHPIIVLTLLKTHKKSRESSLHNKYSDAFTCIKEILNLEDELQFLTLDLDAVFRSKGTGVLKDLKDHASSALKQCGFYSGLIEQSVTFKALCGFSYSRINSDCCSCETKCNKSKHQTGILRTNCLDSLDRTNVAQFVYSLVALAHQLVDLKIMESPEIDFDQPLAHRIMNLYEDMGNALAQQYGGSAAHSKIFSKIRGQYGPVTQVSELIKTIERHYSNSVTDVDKQTAMNIFLGHFKPGISESAPVETNLENNYIQEGSTLYT